MDKLIAKFAADRSVRNAIAIRAYDRKHPMASCMLDKAGSDLKADAIHMANSQG